MFWSHIPRNSDIFAILSKHKSIVHSDPINRLLFLEGSLLFRRRRSLRHWHCQGYSHDHQQVTGAVVHVLNSDQIHQHLVTTNTVISPWDNRPRKITKKLNCSSPNLVYYLKCTDCPAGPGVTPHYVGSSVRFKGRWSSHKNDMIKGVGKDCGFCEHWARHHKADLSDISKIQIYFLSIVRTLEQSKLKNL